MVKNALLPEKWLYSQATCSLEHQAAVDTSELLPIAGASSAASIPLLLAW
jgi:hypothetical protein